jgi:hypothetical protein
MDAAAPAPVCTNPQCRSPYLELTQLGGYNNVQIPDGEGWEKAGEVEMAFDPSFAVRYSLTRGPELSPWLYHERDEIREVVEFEYGRLPGTATDNAWARDEIMHPGRILRRAERDRGVNLDFESDDECVLIQRFFYEPEMLHFTALNQPTPLPNGEVIPAGVRLSEVFPKGMCIKTTPGLPYFLDVYRESHKDRFIHGKYNVSPGKAMPRGNDEAPQYNKFLNVLLSGAFDHTLKTLAPSIAIIDEIFGDGRLFNRDDRTIRVKLAQILALQGAGLEGAFKAVAPPPLNNAAASLIESFTSELRRATKSETYLNAEDEGIDPETATAVRVGENRNARGNTLQLSMFAHFLMRSRERTLKLSQENYGEMRRASRYDEEKRDRVAVIVRLTDISVEFRLWVEKDSWLPNLDLEVRAAWKEGMEALSAGLQAGLPKEPLIRSINRAYNIDIASDSQLKRIRSCEETLDFIRELLPTAVDAWSLYEKAPVNPYEIDHEACYLWWREWLTWKGRNAHPLLRQVALIYIQVHAAAWLGDRTFLEAAAQIGMGLIAAPIQAGITAEQQQPPRVMAAPAGGASPSPADAQQAGGGATAAGSGYQNQQFDVSNLTI